MAMEWPDYENELKKKDKAKRAKKRNHDSFIVEDSDDDKLRNANYRADKRKQQGKSFMTFKVFLFAQMLCIVGLLFQVEVDTLFLALIYLLKPPIRSVCTVFTASQPTKGSKSEIGARVRVY